jgi:hypothetical protein
MAYSYVRWVPCDHTMVRPQVADGGDDLQILRIAVNILNKQSKGADKGWSSSLGLGRGIFMFIKLNNILILSSRVHLYFPWGLPFRFSDRNFKSFSDRFHACYMSSQSPLP